MHVKKEPADPLRRNLLLGIGAIAAGSGLGLLGSASARQFGTDVSWAKYEKYEASPMRAEQAMLSRGTVTRKSISMLAPDSDELRMFREAVGVMRARSERNLMHPNGWVAQATQHSLYCSSAVNGLQVHWSWLFLPWHRGYVYFLERAMAAAIGEPGFALPYWDSSSDRRIPLQYWGRENPLNDTTRLQRPEDTIPSDFMDVNACLLPSDFRTFGGYPYRSDDQELVEGVMESMFHNNCHNWTGGNLATFWNSAYDPVFSGHHNNIDRAWEAWMAMPGHEMPEEKEWYETVFTYPNERGQLQRISIGDLIDTAALGYRFDTLDVVQPDITAPELNGRATSFAVTLDKPGRKAVANSLRTGRRYALLRFTRVQANALAVPLCARIFLGIENEQPDFVTTITILPVQNGGAPMLNRHVNIQLALKPGFIRHIESGRPLVAWLDPVPLRGRIIPEGAVRLDNVEILAS